MPLNKQGPFTKKVTDLPDQPSPDFTATDVKNYLQTPADELMTSFNNAMDKLKDVTDDDSGADNIGATQILDLDGLTIQSILESMRNKLRSITDGSSGADFVKATSIANLSGSTVQELLESLKGFTDKNHTDLSNYATDIDNRKAEKTNVYSRSQAETSFYFKSQVEDRIASYNGGDRFIDGGTFLDSYNGNIEGINGGAF